VALHYYVASKGLRCIEYWFVSHTMGETHFGMRLLVLPVIYVGLYCKHKTSDYT